MSENQAGERGPNYNWQHEAEHYRAECDKLRDLLGKVEAQGERDAYEASSLRLLAESYRAMLSELLNDWDAYFTDKQHHIDIPEIAKRKEMMERVRAALEGK